MVAGEKLWLVGLVGAFALAGMFIGALWHVFTNMKPEDTIGLEGWLSIPVVMPAIIFCLSMAGGRLRLLFGYEPLRSRRFHFPYRRGHLSDVPGYDLGVFAWFLNAVGVVTIALALSMLFFP